MPRAVFYSKGSPDMMIHSANKPEQTLFNGQVVTKVSNDWKWNFRAGKLILDDPAQIDALRCTPQFLKGIIVLGEYHEQAPAPESGTPEPVVEPAKPTEVPGVKTKNDAIQYLLANSGATAEELKGLKVVEVATLAKEKYNVVFVDWNG